MKILNYALSLAVIHVCAVIGMFVVPAAPEPAAVSFSGNAAPSFRPCRVTSANGTTATVVATRKSVFLAKGTALTITSESMHQGFIAVKTQVEGRLTTVSVTADDTNCLS